ncbi:transport and Golgi organization protein 1 homolog [Silurus meridionalis]|uniref:transport and Golgi organization protein 1 homolog n=1 Tax=Silurus meridionalis TaxID=175797 RepID=UPI001EEC0D3B|nr:transport and Golgi organization protein 1 homolog [Silurus meridionalis]XP_046728771.1 transport and Golgi organization protein 1 homolog [Silurus meridionalis]
MPEDWRPGLTFHVLPWNPVVVAAVVGVLTLLVFLWRTVLPVKRRRSLMTEKQLISEKSEVLQKVSELNKTIKQHEEKLSNSEESRSSQQEEFLKLMASV